MRYIIILVLILFTKSSAFSQEIVDSLPVSHQEYLSQKEYNNLLDHTINQLDDFDILGIKAGIVKIQMGEYPYSFSLLPIVEQSAEFAFNSTQRNELVNEYITMLLSAYADQQMLSEADFSSVKKYLKLQLYPGAAMDGEEKNRWLYRTDLEGTITCAVLDLPTARATVERNQLTKWNITEEEVWRTAQENTANHKYEAIQKTVADSVKIIALGEVNAALVLDKVLSEPIGEYGAIVAAPHEEIMLVHNLEVDNLDSFQAVVEYLHSFVSEQYQGHPDPISPYFYWYSQGEYTRIRLGKDQHGKLHIFPPVAMDLPSEQ